MTIREKVKADFREEWYAMRALHAAPKTDRSPLQWAREERWLGQGVSPLSQNGPIRYDPDAMPWCKEPMEAAVDPDVQETVLWWASGMGKTEVVMNILGHAICEEPANAFVVYPKEDSRDKFSQDVVDRAIESTPAMQHRVVTKKSRDVGNTIARKKYPGGSLFMTSAGSASNFRGPRAKIIFCDEVDAYPTDVDGEGDPIALAYKRAEGFHNSVKIISGTGTWSPLVHPDGQIEYRSRIHQKYEGTDKRKWFFPCRECGHLQVPMFAQIKAPKGHPEKARYYCESGSCNVEHTNAQYQRQLRLGRWMPTAPFTGRRGYWINGFATTLPAEKGFKTKLHQFVADAEEAEKSPMTKRVWINTTCAELDTPEGVDGEQPPAWKPIWEAREDYGPSLPMRGLYLTAGVDCQLNRLEVEWDVWGENEESWGMDHIVIEGAVRDAATWKALRQELKRRWVREDGAPMTLGMALIDGGDYAEDVYAFLQDLARNPEPGLNGHVRASKGFGKHGHPIIDRTFRTVAKNLKGHHIGTWEAKDRIYERLRYDRVADDTREGVIHFNKRFSEEYFQQLVAEQVSITYERGVEIRKYVNPKKLRNEGLDMKVMNLAAFRLHPHNLEAIAQGLKEAAEEAKGTKRQPEPQRHRSGQNWATAGLKW